MAGKRPAQLFIDLLLCLALVAVLAILHFGVAPFKRGFFCNDESIQKPYVTKQTVPFALLCGAGFAALIIVVSSNFVLDIWKYLVNCSDDLLDF